MEFTIEMLQDKIPASVYELLTTEDHMSFPLPEEKDIDEAYAFISPAYIPCGWHAISQRPLTKEEISAVKCCTIVESQYGLSMRFDLTDKKPSHVPCGNSNSFEAGQEWKAEDLSIVEMEREGEEFTIFRVMPITERVDIWNDEFKNERKQREDISGLMLHRYHDIIRRDGKKISIFKYLRAY